MSRSVEEWIGKTDDDAIPPRVRLRVFAAHRGICYLSGRRIRPSDAWDCDHVVALANGGEHRERNLAPALRDKHREKTAADVALKAKNDRVSKRHIGIKKPSKFACSRNSKFKKRIDGGVVLR
jgi:5-methylcytosine-specific restriction protein A